MAAHGGEVYCDADGLADGEVKCGSCVLPGGDGDFGEPFVERRGGVGILGEEGADFCVDAGFPVGMDRDVQKHPAGWAWVSGLGGIVGTPRGLRTIDPGVDHASKDEGQHELDDVFIFQALAQEYVDRIRGWY